MKKEYSYEDLVKVCKGTQLLADLAYYEIFDKKCFKGRTLKESFGDQFININNKQLWSSTMKCGKGKKRK